MQISFFFLLFYYYYTGNYNTINSNKSVILFLLSLILLTLDFLCMFFLLSIYLPRYYKIHMYKIDVDFAYLKIDIIFRMTYDILHVMLSFFFFFFEHSQIIKVASFWIMCVNKCQ